MKTFLLEIITPSKVSFSEEVEMVTVPSKNGLLGILPNHVPLMANLTDEELKKSRTLELKTEKVQILVTRAVREDELNEKTILKAKKEAEEALLRKPTAEEFRTASALLRSSLIDLKILSKRKRFKQQ